MKYCKNLQTKLTVDGESDICGVDLCNELNNVKGFYNYQLEDKTPLGVLNFIKKAFSTRLVFKYMDNLPNFIHDSSYRS